MPYSASPMPSTSNASGAAILPMPSSVTSTQSYSFSPDQPTRVPAMMAATSGFFSTLSAVLPKPATVNEP